MAYNIDCSICGNTVPTSHSFYVNTRNTKKTYKVSGHVVVMRPSCTSVAPNILSFHIGFVSRVSLQKGISCKWTSQLYYCMYLTDLMNTDARGKWEQREKGWKKSRTQRKLFCCSHVWSCLKMPLLHCHRSCSPWLNSRRCTDLFSTLPHQVYYTPTVHLSLFLLRG